MVDINEDDFAKKWGFAPSSASSASAPTINEDDFAKKWGYSSAPDMPTVTVTAPKPKDAPAPQPAPDYTTYEGLSRALAPAPNTTYGELLPLARDNATGSLHFAMPGALRTFAQGALDLAHGPQTGTVTPEGTAALATIVPSLNPSVAAGTYGLVNGSATRLVPGPNGKNILATPEEVAANPMASGGAAPGEQTGPATARAAQEAKEYAAIPENLPPSPMFPPATQSAAEARADQLIKHFAAKSGPIEDQDLVPGFLPTLAQKTGDPGLATLERGVRDANPQSAFAQRFASNQQAVRDYTTKLVGTPEDVEALQAARDAATAPMREKALQNAQPVDITPVEQKIQTILSGPDNKRDAIVGTLSNIQRSLHVGGDLNAPLEADPNMLYGIRMHINDLLAPAAQRDNPQLQAAARQLTLVKNSLDNMIEQGAPGFKAYIQQYADMSRPIDEKQYLQGLNLTDQAGNVSGASVDRALKGIAKLQQAPGANKAGSISDETMDALQRLHRTIQMQRLSDTAGKPANSTTFQNLATNSAVRAVTGNTLFHVGAGVLGEAASGGLTGGVLGAASTAAARGITNRAETLVRNAIIERLLNLQGKGEAVLKPTAKPGLGVPMPPPNPLSAGARPFA